MTEFFRFPQIPHIAWLPEGEPRIDKVLSSQEMAAFLQADLVVEEKLDGANLGFSLSSEGNLHVQNRGQYLNKPYAVQFARLPDWISLHGDRLRDVLLQHSLKGLMLFGEWCAARHSLDYDQLPDWFLLFDVYDRGESRFWSVKRRDALATALGQATVPLLAQGRFTLPQLTSLISSRQSQFRKGPLEGVVIRRDSPDWCDMRAKLVRADFTQGINEHWSRRNLQWNRIR